jgi:hypothetical protein
MRQSPLQGSPALFPVAWSGAAVDSSGAADSPAWRHVTQERQLLAMLAAYRRTGGVASGDEVAGLLLQKHRDQTLSTVARWIVARQVVSFTWQCRTLLPLFQFDASTMSLRAPVTAVLDELSCAFDEWELALWFAEPNAWLGDAVPADRILVDAPAVLKAAQADRFIARG